MKICSNCGGSYKESESKCPYCGMINEVGAEKEYKEKLNKIRKDLDNVDELAVADYKGELKTFFKTFLVTLVIVGFIALSAVTAQLSKRDGFGGGERQAMDAKIAEIKKLRHYTDKWDMLYDAGKYDAMCDSIAADNGSMTLFEWQHYNFYTGYQAYYDTRRKMAELAAKDNPASYQIADAIHSALYAYYMTVSSRNTYKYTPEEQALFETEWPKLVDEVCTAYGLTKEEFDTLRIKAGSDSYPDYTEVSHYVEERMNK